MVKLHFILVKRKAGARTLSGCSHLRFYSVIQIVLAFSLLRDVWKNNHAFVDRISRGGVIFLCQSQKKSDKKGPTNDASREETDTSIQVVLMRLTALGRRKMISPRPTSCSLKWLLIGISL